MKPKTEKLMAWAVYDKDSGELLTTGDWSGEQIPRLYESRRGARFDKIYSERVVRVEVTIKPVEGK